MAYKKRTKARRSTRGSRQYNSRGSRGRNAGRSRGRSSSRSQTLRIVVEQPQAVSSVAPQTSRVARKAMF